MKCFITKVSDWGYKEEKEISTLEELVQFIQENGCCVIGFEIDLENWPDDQPDPPVKGLSLEIYDSYRE